MKTFRQYLNENECESGGCSAEDFIWDGEPLPLDEVQTGSVSFMGLAFSALTGTLPLYLAYKVSQKRLAKAMAGCTDEDSIAERNRCLYNFRKQKIENTIKLLSKAKGKEKDSDKAKKIDRKIADQKEKLGELRAHF